MHIEQRQHERFKVNLEVTFSSGSFVCSTPILNISMGGLCIECGKAIPKDQSLTILVPTRPPVRVQGKVAWSVKKGLNYLLGIKFDPLTEEQKRAILELIRGLFWENKSW